MIHLIGPGGAGKSTAGPLLAQRLGLPFHDLDLQFVQRYGCIDKFIATRGYPAYARANVEAYQSLGRDAHDSVAALSSGFMTYPPGTHPRYAEVRDAIARSPTTFVLLPSLALEACVTETVRRQLVRGLGRKVAEREESVIRERFGVYIALPASKVETMQAPGDVAAEIANSLIWRTDR